MMLSDEKRATSTDAATSELLNLVDQERDAKSRLLYELARKIRPHIHQTISRLSENMVIDLPNGVNYQLLRLTWTGIDENDNVRRNADGHHVLVRNGRALNNERRNFYVNNIQYQVNSPYLFNDRPIALGDENDLSAFWEERAALLQRAAALERDRSGRIRQLINSVPELPRDNNDR